jgi:hypothetical protein
MSPAFLTQVELASRWRISPRTLERWRWAGDGPRFIKIGGLVRYRLEDIEGFEAEQLRQITGDGAVVTAGRGGGWQQEINDTR